MSAAAPSMSRHEFETLIIERAWKVPEFRQQFVSDPKGTIEKYTGQKLPQTLNIVVHEEDAETMHLTIPVPPRDISELSDEDLERVAGGTDIVAMTIVTVAITATVSVAASVAANSGRGGW